MIRDTNFYFPTGALMLDMVVGGNKNVYGFKSGTIINIVGDKSAGKSFICNEIIAASHYKYGDKLKWKYADCERGYTFNTEEMYGFDINDEQHSDELDTVEDAFYKITKFAETIEDDECGIYVLDSLDGLTSSEQDGRADERIKAMDNDKEYDKGSYGMGKQKYLSQEFFPQLCKTLMNKHILLIIVSQVRDKIDPMSFEKYSRAGGKALDFYCHTVLWLAGAGKILVKDTPVGGVVKAKTTKSKTPRPFRDCFYSFMFDYGVDDTGSCLDYLYDLRLDSGKLSAPLASSIPWEVDPDKLEVNAKNVRQWLKDNRLWNDYTDSDFYESKATLDTELAFINSKEDVKTKYAAEFSATMDREHLIQFIEDNNLQEELHNRVIAKWESFNESLATTRKKKYYAVQPKNTDETDGFVG